MCVGSSYFKAVLNIKRGKIGEITSGPYLCNGKLHRHQNPNGFTLLYGLQILP